MPPPSIGPSTMSRQRLRFLNALPLALFAASACSSQPATRTTAGDSSAAGANAPVAAASAARTDTAANAAGGMAGMAGMTGHADQDFLRMMSDHHKGLIAMAHPTMEGKGATPAVRTDARKLDKVQDAELDTMVTMLEKSFKDPYGPKVTPNNQAMADSLARQTGAAYDRTFYKNVIAHHKEAIGMIDQYLPKLTRPDLKAMAQRMKADQTREIAEYHRKLGQG